ncbi:MAG: protein transport protein bet1 [Piccolia ochrophora]|nr:MAG: protein transport protein bet1 [Piccolia ochrophora]
MSSRFGHSNLHNRDPRSALFDSYTGDKARTGSASPARGGLPSHSSNGSLHGGSPSFRPATPNSRGQYSDAVLSELESQNDDQLEGMSAKVKMLKDITVAIGDEIRDSSVLAEKMV